MSARDYKNAGRADSPLDLSRYRQFGIGLTLGVALALFVWLYDHRVQPQAAESPPEATKPESPAAKTAGAAGRQG